MGHREHPLITVRSNPTFCTIVNTIRAWAFRQRVLPESSLGKAIAYMLGLWPGLTRFLDDARIPLDTNTAPAPSAAPRSPPSYSLIKSAKLCRVNPKAYLLEATHDALANPGTAILPRALLN